MQVLLRPRDGASTGFRPVSDHSPHLTSEFSLIPLAGRRSWVYLPDFMISGWNHMDPAIGPFRVLRSLALVAISGALVAACASSSTAGRSAVTTVRSTTTTSSTSVTRATGSAAQTASPVLVQQVTSAWKQAQSAFDNAALTSNPEYPALAETFTDPQLTRIRQFLEQQAADGDSAEGTSSSGSTTVTLEGPDLAKVQSCVNDQEIEIVSATGQPVPGVLGEPDFELVASLMRLTQDGWKLSDQTVVVGGCTGS